MSNKERILQLINDIPENKLFIVVNMLESLKTYAGESVIPDEWDLEMIIEAKKENSGETKTFDEVCNMLGVQL